MLLTLNVMPPTTNHTTPPQTQEFVSKTGRDAVEFFFGGLGRFLHQKQDGMLPKLQIWCIPADSNRNLLQKQGRTLSIFFWGGLEILPSPSNPKKQESELKNAFKE